MAGTETNIALKLLNINRLGYPHGVCQDGDEFRKQYNVTYTRRACQHHCEQSMIMDQCDCYNEQGGEIVQMAMNSHLNVCRSESDLGCMLRIQRQFERGSVPCGCENPCNEKDYVKTVSMRHWPADAYTPVLVETLCGHRDARECDKYRQADTRTIAHSFVKLNIFYEDLNYENITEVEDYELPQFASDVGGTVGLWLGLSVLSGFEVVQFLMELATYLLSFSCCHNNCQLHRQARRRVRNKESSRKLSDAFGTERWECSRTRQQPHGSWSSRQ
ncbi:hypothetical protein C0Q70_16359 [Pomacea canaliculata]|uniref:Uncharacterized protein n=1 Tax=Pomacea canaliculata TaxID=400727 RepID=A0A2T7NPK0_POMCA|nr:amiloride-sensitive sodium channel subunit delta-like [Pomacea canaliculata]XP_025110838.1 amiloride-sensitive sodium channel subunit delta-like [Pomacea canaliculata]PVD23097.1 hypothetical protein C0Q70_16359 [Pomacea canaliculata]